MTDRELTPEIHFYHAIALGDLSKAEQLLRAGADINAFLGDFKKKTPLQMAADSGFTALCEMLLDKGADMHVRDGRGNTALHLATRNSHSDTVKLLLDRGARADEKNNIGKAPLHLAAIFGADNTDILQMLLDADANPNAVSNDQYSSDQYANTPLHEMAAYGRTEMMKLLIARGADIEQRNKNGDTPMHMAAFAGRVACMRELLEHGADIQPANKTGGHPLHVAAIFGRPESMTVLLDNHAPVNALDSAGQTPLQRVVRIMTSPKEQRFRGQYDACVVVLLAAGAEIRDECRRLILSRYAVKLTGRAIETRREMLSQLINRGVTLSGQLDNYKGSTLLSKMCRHSTVPDEDIIMLLGADCKEDINTQDPQGRTPLMQYLSRTKPSNISTDVIVALLDAGADTTLQDKDGFTPVDLAIEHGLTDHVTLLRAHVADGPYTGQSGPSRTN